MKYRALSLVTMLLATVSSQGPFDPEETLFIFTRCMEDNLKDDETRLSTLSKWKEWQTEPANDTTTHCFLKCILDKTGLYDGSTGKFNADIVRKQFNKYPNLAQKAEVDKYVRAVERLPSSRNECTAVFNAYSKVHKKHKLTSKNLFHGNREMTKKIYEDQRDQIRQKGQSYMRFCEDKYYPVGSKDRRKICDIVQYKIFDDSVYKEHTDCVMRGVRYITKTNKLDRDEIKRDFRQVSKDTAKVDQVLNQCRVMSKDIAWEYFKCLVESPIFTDFKEAFDYREERSQNYAYNLEKIRSYKKPSEDVIEIDGKKCI